MHLIVDKCELPIWQINNLEFLLISFIKKNKISSTIISQQCENFSSRMKIYFQKINQFNY